MTTLEAHVVELPGERVTRSLLRVVELPGGGGRIALVTLDDGEDHTRPSTLGPAGLRLLAEAIDQAAAAAGVLAVAVTGKPYVFAAGADLTAVAGIATREQAHAAARQGHDVLRRLGELPVPTFAFVNGVALGGGMELALHCTYRTASTAVSAIGLPEVGIGLVPGWGGAWLLPNLVGAATAVDVAVRAPLRRRTMDARAAYRAGLVDALFEPADFLERSLDWAGQVLRGDIQVLRTPPERGPAWQAAVDEGRRAVDASLHGAAPAPYRCLDLLEQARTTTRDEGFAAEDEALADLLLGDETRAALYAFDLTRRHAERMVPEAARSAARPVTKVGIVGAGLMASQLALLHARRLQLPVVITDLDQERVDRGLGRVAQMVDDLVARGRLTTDRANRLRARVTGRVGLDAFADCDLVVEAVVEDLEVKKEVLRRVERVVDRSTVLASNTSALPLAEMAAVLDRPERLVGMHFFNPVQAMPLLEVVRTPVSSEQALATAYAVGKALGKTCLPVADAPAFVVNRLLVRLSVEVLGAVDDGVSLEAADRALDPLGLPMRPLELATLVGPAVLLHVSEHLSSVWPERFRVPRAMRSLAAGTTPRTDGGERGPSAEELRRTVEDALAEEARLLLDEGVVAGPREVDLAMLLGAGWPAHLGGLTPYLDRCGASERATGRSFLPAGAASVPRETSARR